MRKILIISIIGLLVACTDVDPIKVREPQRKIDTESLIKYKSDLQSRNISIGIMYGWGQLNESNLTFVPDSLDIIIVKENYTNLTNQQEKELKNVQTLKATKVLIGLDFNTKISKYEEIAEKEFKKKKVEKEEEWKASQESLTQDERTVIIERLKEAITQKYHRIANDELKELPKTFLELIKNNNFNGLSVEIPKNFDGIYSETVVEKFLSSVSEYSGKNQKYYLVIENPFETAKVTIEKANWVIWKQNINPALLVNFDKASRLWNHSNFLPSADFSSEENIKGFSDSQSFRPGEKIPQTMDITKWSAKNKSGVAFYHIEKDYNNMVGRITYKMLRQAIQSSQL